MKLNVSVAVMVVMAVTAPSVPVAASIFNFANAATNGANSASAASVEEKLESEYLQLSELEEQATESIKELRNKILAAGGEEALRLATEYQYMVLTELDGKYEQTRPSNEELDAIARELGILLEAVDRAERRQEAEEYLDQAISIIVEDLAERFHSRIEILQHLREQKVNGDVNSEMSRPKPPEISVVDNGNEDFEELLEMDENTDVSDEQLIEYGFELARLEILLDAKDRMATMIGSYEGGREELATRPFQNASAPQPPKLLN